VTGPFTIRSKILGWRCKPEAVISSTFDEGFISYSPVSWARSPQKFFPGTVTIPGAGMRANVFLRALVVDFRTFAGRANATRIAWARGSVTRTTREKPPATVYSQGVGLTRLAAEFGELSRAGHGPARL